MSEFIDHLHEVFAEFGPIRARRMFGGYGIYYEGIMFALVADEVLYLKADKSTLETFEKRGLAPFEYVKGNKRIKMSYYSAPEEVLDDPEAAAHWGRQAYAVALAAKRS